MRYRKLLSALSLLFTVGVLGCVMLIPIEYRKEHPELFTEAIHSLLGVKGYHSHGDAIIKIMEKDEYDRVLFYYREDEMSEHLLIAQKSDGVYVYYYPDFNFISHSYSLPDFSEQAILELKDKNDWNKPLDESKSIKQNITRIKPEYSLDKDLIEEIFEKAIDYSGKETISRGYNMYLTSDENGKKLFLCLGVIPYGNRDWIYLAIIINADGSCDLATCFMKLTDLYNYQHDLKAFKELNNWTYF
jgi:hypothetical protein